MSYKFSFADNEVYSATDVNNITKRLVTAGVADSFSDGVAYNVSRFNEAGKLLYTSGVVSENCNTLKVVKVSDTEILINPGYAFFDDGAVIEIEAGGESLSFVLGSKNYVYLKNNLLEENRCYPCCTTKEPTGDFVILAEIDENGEVTDKRMYAKGKLPGYQSVSGNIVRLKERIEMSLANGQQYTGSKSFDVGNNDFQYVLSYVAGDEKSLPCLGIYNIEKDAYLGFAKGSVAMLSEDKLYVSKSYNELSAPDVYMKVTLSDGSLTVSLEGYKHGTYTFPNGIDIDILLF